MAAMLTNQAEQGAGPPWGVGLIGAGLVTRAIHAPTLAGLSHRFAVKEVWDVDITRAEALAELCGGHAAASLAELTANPSVDVVAVCSPAVWHAEHAIAAMRAGAKAVLVEKPLCASLAEAEAICAAARETGATLLVGSMHLYDPAWRFLEERASSKARSPTAIRSSIVLPPNGRFEDWSTEPLGAPAAGLPNMEPAALMRMAIMELAIHDLPLVRRLLPPGAQPHVTSARQLKPFGYAITVQAGGALIDLFSQFHGHWQSDWTLTATAPEWQGVVSFTPSFVPAGSGSARVTGTSGTVVHDPSPTNGYGGEWLEIARILARESLPPDPQALLDDFAFALSIAEQASAIIALGEAA
jgi:predicted dehydrogenase